MYEVPNLTRRKYVRGLGLPLNIWYYCINANSGSAIAGDTSFHGIPVDAAMLGL
jgi:hypothetical protein